MYDDLRKRGVGRREHVARINTLHHGRRNPQVRSFTCLGINLEQVAVGWIIVKALLFECHVLHIKVARRIGKDGPKHALAWLWCIPAPSPRRILRHADRIKVSQFYLPRHLAILPIPGHHGRIEPIQGHDAVRFAAGNKSIPRKPLCKIRAWQLVVLQKRCHALTAIGELV